MKLGQYIKQLRESKDLSLREFASRINKTPSFICDIELGRRNPSQVVLNEMAKFFNIDVGEFEKYDERVPVEDMKKYMKSNPTSGAAFSVFLRKATENKVTKKDLDKLYKNISEKKE